jgi:DNA-directed RNA polymerase specialized sigma24 family protein
MDGTKVTSEWLEEKEGSSMLSDPPVSPYFFTTALSKFRNHGNSNTLNACEHGANSKIFTLARRNEKRCAYISAERSVWAARRRMALFVGRATRRSKVGFKVIDGDGRHMQTCPAMATQKRWIDSTGIRIAWAPQKSKVGSMVDRRFHPFPNTHWSLVKRAGFADEDARREALWTLLERYQPALRSYLLYVRRMPADAADELLQAFIAERILEHELVRKADHNIGRFRAFLLTSLNHFATSHYRSERIRATQTLAAEACMKMEAAVDANVEAAWARELIHGVIKAMRQECTESGREDIWTVFESRVLARILNNQDPASYEDLATRLSLSSPVQAANLLVTAKRMYMRMLRAAVSEYEMEPADVDEEIKDLWGILARSPHPSDI